jgi:hypothetical protein
VHNGARLQNQRALHFWDGLYHWIVRPEDERSMPPSPYYTVSKFLTVRSPKRAGFKEGCQRHSPNSANSPVITYSRHRISRAFRRTCHPRELLFPQRFRDHLSVLLLLR